MLSRYGENCASNCKKGKKDYFWCWTRWHVGEVGGYNKKNSAEFTFLILMSTQLFVQGGFLTGMHDFQYQNEKQVAADQDYFFTKFSM